MLLGIILLLAIACDQTFKYLVINNIRQLGRVSVIPGLLNITYVENRGAAFGVLQNCWYIFVAALIVVVAFFVYFIAVKKKRTTIFIISAALILGGGISNFIDRATYGYVIDYIQISFFPPVCNLADYCVTTGTILLLVYFLFMGDDGKSKTKKPDKTSSGEASN